MKFYKFTACAILVLGVRVQNIAANIAGDLLARAQDTFFGHQYNHLCENRVDFFSDYLGCIILEYWKTNMGFNPYVHTARTLGYFNNLTPDKKQKIYAYFARDCQKKYGPYAKVLPANLFSELDAVQCFPPE
jgi:hypothetical protein